MAWAGAPSLERNGEDNLPARSVDKALAILKQFSASEPQLGVSELGRRLGLTKSTVHRLLGSLVKAGLAEQDPNTRQYMLGREAVQLGYTAIYSDPLLNMALPYLHYLAHEAGETAYLAERRGDQAVTVLQVLSPTLREQLRWSKEMPLHSTSSGKVLLAYAEERERKAVLNRGLARYTEHTVTDPEVLREQLRNVREDGYAVSFEEHSLGYNGVAVPVRDPDDQVIAALTLAGPAYSLTRARIMAGLEQLRAIAGEISHKLREAR